MWTLLNFLETNILLIFCFDRHMNGSILLTCIISPLYSCILYYTLFSICILSDTPLANSENTQFISYRKTTKNRMVGMQVIFRVTITQGMISIFYIKCHMSIISIQALNFKVMVALI